ncbi:MAG TPA: hypothetical protein VL327_08850 [Pyrinomonadaceae bacterium]|jgi:endonuclease-3|nr:hypothetical protein [Pyrinomonadaceae bacterium]
MIPNKKAQTAEIAKRLKKLYPDPVVELDYATPFELIIASLLAAQNRDTTINKITPNLFRKYRCPTDYVAVDQAELEEDIHDSGFSGRNHGLSKRCQMAGRPHPLLYMFSVVLH